MMPEDIRLKIADWINKLSTGDGDYKKISAQDYMELLINLKLASSAEIHLYNNLVKIMEGKNGNK